MKLSCFCGVLIVLAAGVSAAEHDSIPDHVSYQEVGEQIRTERPVTTLAARAGTLWVGQQDGLYLLEAGRLQPVESAPPGPIRKLGHWDDTLWVIAGDGIYRQSGETFEKLGDGQFVGAAAWGGRPIVASANALYVVEGGALALLGTVEPAHYGFQDIAVHADTIYLCGIDRLVTFDGIAFDHRNVLDLGALPSKDLRAVASLGHTLTVACHAGIGLVRGTTATQLLGADGLPWEETTCVTAGTGGDLWIGTTRGAIRRTTGGAFHYFHGPRWLPGERVNSIAVDGHDVFIATDGGLGVLRYEPYTLLKKARYYEQHLEAWAQKRMVFTHKLEWNQDAGKWMREVSDNDIGWSTHYWAAQAFRHAVTGEPQARELAIQGFNALKWSEEMSGITGFPARSVWAVGETGHKASGGSGHYAAEWHPTPDGLWEWKGDTSSDEIDAQFYYASIFYDLIADEALKPFVREHLARIAGHIIDNGYTLRDVDGKPTVWGRWDPEYLSSLKGSYARGLNGLGILSYLRTAAHVSGQPRFEQALQELLNQGYHEPVIWQKHVSPPMLVNHSDDRLAFYLYYPLLQYETDPRLRSIYRRSLDRSWAIERVENNPWFTFIYGGLTGAPERVQEAAGHLRAWPLDLINHPYDHSHRRDLGRMADAIDYTNEGTVLSPRERGPLRWSDNPFELKGGSGREVVDPAGWLDAYWMGRYFGFIEAPQTDDEAALVPAPLPTREDVVPYDGPPMPSVLQ